MNDHKKSNSKRLIHKLFQSHRIRQKLFFLALLRKEFHQKDIYMITKFIGFESRNTLFNNFNFKKIFFVKHESEE